VDLRKERSEAICRRCSALPEYKEAETVLLYCAVGSEADLMPLARTALSEGKTVAFPKCGEGGRMSFYSVTELSCLVPGKYGIPEPPEKAPVLSFYGAVCFVPALSFDVEGYRLGYGGGYYDRFLADFCGVSIGVTFDDTLAERLPREKYDKKTDYIVTESKVKKTIED